MTTLTGSRPTAVGSTRTPAAAIVAAALVALLSTFGAYGAIYFTGLEGWDDAGITFVTTYEFVSLSGLLAAVALFRGHHVGLVAVAWYAVFHVVFTTMKLVTIQEISAIPFGVAGVVVLALVTRASVRDHVAR